MSRERYIKADHAAKRGAILRLVKVNKGMQVDTLVPQAMKDVPSCEKRRGAAKKL